MLKTSLISLSVISVLIAIVNINHLNKEQVMLKEKPIAKEKENQSKFSTWSLENAKRHQDRLQKMMKTNKSRKSSSIDGSQNYANGHLNGHWRNRGPNNIPGAFEFSEMLDGTDTMYAITFAYYGLEYNVKSFIYKGTVYNPKTGTKGDDFVNITPQWPNKFQDLIALTHNDKTRLIAGIEKGPIYYSDDEGTSWELSKGLPDVIVNTIANRQEDKIYATDGRYIYLSIDAGENFTMFQDFDTYEQSGLYSPRYATQVDADYVYLSRKTSFYTLSSNSSSFVENSASYHSEAFVPQKISIGGDSRKLYVTFSDKYFVSDDQGASWTKKLPAGNKYGNKRLPMRAGKYIAVHPENPEIVIGGLEHPVYSSNGLDSSISDSNGWGTFFANKYLPLQEQQDVIRFNYHPDFQANQFFYNSSGDLFSMRSGDGGLIMSYKDWYDLPIGDNINSDGYDNAHFINISLNGATNALIYHDAMFTGYKDERHLIYATQDQGTQVANLSSTKESMDFSYHISGDGPTMASADGKYVWYYQNTGRFIYPPVKMYSDSGHLRSPHAIKGEAEKNKKPRAEFEYNHFMDWTQMHIDNNETNKRIWFLAIDLLRAEVDDDGIITPKTTKIGSENHQITTLAQAHSNPDLLWLLKEGKVFSSTNRGDSFDDGMDTPFAMTFVDFYDNKKEQYPYNYGSAYVLPSDDNFILFCGPSANEVGSILSEDGGKTWKDVTGDFPAGNSQMTGGMIATPDSKYIFAGTDIGPWVFVVSQKRWYPISQGSEKFITSAIEYIPSTNSIRFGTWGSGVWDFKIEDITPTKDVYMGHIPYLLL